MQTIKNMPKHLRPRERLMEKGAVNLKDKDLLAILLRTGRHGKNVLEIASEVLQKYPMKKLLQMQYNDLIAIKGIDSSKACTLLAAFEITKRALEVDESNLPKILSAEDAASHVSNFSKNKKEHFIALYLNARNQLIEKEIISIGIINASLIHPREVFAPAIKNFCCSVIVAHNHPSGECEPSDDDIEVTKQLIKAGDILGIDVLDHIIITEKSFSSLKERGII